MATATKLRITPPTASRPPSSLDEHPDHETYPFAGQAKFSLTQAMSSMLALGLPIEQVAAMVTTNAAAMIGLEDELGTLGIGKTADVSVLSDDRGRFILRDNEKTGGRGGTIAAAAVLLARRQALRCGRGDPTGGDRSLIARLRRDYVRGRAPRVSLRAGRLIGVLMGRVGTERFNSV
jgi:hypothetical protein